MNVYAKAKDGVIVEYPVYDVHIAARYEPVSNYTPVVFTSKPKPALDEWVREVIELVAGVPTVRYELVKYTSEQLVLLLKDVVLSNPQAAVIYQRAVVDLVQQRLDAFARTRGYDNILSACTYATSAVPKFAQEGQAAVNLRDQTWAALYALLDEVQAGARPVPADFAEIEALLPALEWPE